MTKPSLPETTAGLLPEFKAPPVVEVAVSVQFEAPVLEMPHIMQWWSQIRDRFPGFEQAAPIPAATESFDPPEVPQSKVKLELLDTPPVPRIFLKNTADTELIHIQQDRFGYSWRKLKATDDYPRFAAIRKNFLGHLTDFEEFLATQHLESTRPTLCEVTYVNHIVGSGVWNGHGELHRIIPSVTPKLSGDVLSLPENLHYAVRYVMSDEEGSPLGRLHVGVEPRFLTSDMTPIYLMRLSARGAPLGPDQKGVLGMLDMGHEWIVRAFTTLTSPEMHQAWRRTR